MVRLYLVFALGCVLFLSCLTSAALVVDFEDLGYDVNVSAKDDYQDMVWDYSSKPGILFNDGYWISRYYDPGNPVFGTHCIANGYGCIQISFQFPESTFPDGAFLYGAYFCGIGLENTWARAITATGYMDGEEVWSFSLGTITADPRWLGTDGTIAVDKVVIHAAPRYEYDPKYNEYGYFGMDNLSFEEVPEPMTLLLLAIGAAAIHRRNKNYQKK